MAEMMIWRWIQHYYSLVCPLETDTVLSLVTYNIEEDHLAAGGVIATWHLTFVFSAIVRSHVPDHQNKLWPVLPHHRLHSAVQGVAQVVKCHQLGNWSCVLQPRHLPNKRVRVNFMCTSIRFEYLPTYCQDCKFCRPGEQFLPREEWY